MRKFLRLTWRDKWLVLQAVGMLFCVRIGLRLFGYQRLRKHLTGAVTPSKVEISDAVYIGQLVNVVGFRLGANCLHRSLVLWWMLRLRGIDSSLHFGIPRTPSSAFMAHVWVQIGTTVINDSPDIHETYTELTRAPEQERYSFATKPANT